MTKSWKKMVACGAAAATLAIGAPGAAVADPISDAVGLGSSAVDLGSSAVDFGSSVLDFGSGVIGLPGGISSELGGSSGTGPGGAGPSAPPLTQACNASTQSGGAGITDTNHILGVSGPTSFVLSYETYNVPDQIQVFYEGVQVADTGRVGDNINQGTGSIQVGLPPGGSTSVLVRVIGDPGTDWDYTVYCP
ncbi:hypothetical protein [Millisia brevis]|uniref:hypothetical protein n=1 Tax=Millisia brevis TaxID=264148 RepID=UPI001FE1C5A8|nr:hypothetical protein [Millisia brevis]